MARQDDAGSSEPSRKRPAQDDAQDNDDLPQPYNASQLHSVKRRALSPSEQPRKQKRPGARARLTDADREVIRRRQAERDAQLEADNAAAAEAERKRGGINDVVRQHYNNVPQRGREWRTTDSKIKGLRVFNNWVKSCIIQRYSPDEDHTPGSREMGRSSDNELLVLDIGCGKGGDLNKWQQAPQPIQLYVGLDPADVSIEQARDRYRTMQRGDHRGGRGGHHRRPPPRIFDARFAVKDCYSESIEDLDIIRQVGFDPSPMNKRGFDVVSMMFSMHYAFESEKNARTMLRNVAGALKKGGRFIGCIPNSDVLGERVRQFNAKMAAKKKQNGTASKDEKNNGEEARGKEGAENGTGAPPAAAADGDSPPHHPESPPHHPASPPHFAESPPPFQPDSPPHFAESPPHRPATPNPLGESPPHHPDSTTPTTAPPAATTISPKDRDANAPDAAGSASDGEVEEGEAEPTAEWGNSIYRVRFPGPTPEDGIFRPAFGWKYNFFLDEAVEEVPEYVVPWEAFRALADDYNLELQFHRTFPEVWEAEKDDPEMGPLSERMRVRGRGKGPLLVSDEEMEAASFYIGFCFYKV